MLYRPLVREILVETTERGIEAAAGVLLTGDAHAPLRAALVRGASADGGGVARERLRDSASFLFSS